jgi:glycosyltransferase involved in cell wall biosynthesis
LKKIVLISSGQPSVNPRLVKEANALSSVGYEVSVIYSFWTHWAFAMDKKLFSTVNWKPILAGGSPHQNKFVYFLTRLRFKIVTLIANKLTLKYGIAEIAKGRASLELLRKAKSIKADFYIAHNLAALPVAVKAAATYKVKCGFDAEDFHRQEVSDSPLDFNYRIAEFIENKHLFHCAYVTAASPLIAKAYQQLYPKLNPQVINNVFESSHIKPMQINKTGPLKLFWFSQTIGKGRGLEVVVAALNMLKNESIELHLLGSISEESEIYFRNLITFDSLCIYFHSPILPEEIFSFSSQFDVGLALEINTPLNRNICLTNKIFSYLISGLAIIASDTTAQKAFLEENEGIGFTYSIGNVAELADKIDLLFKNKVVLSNCKLKSSLLAAKKYNWEMESPKFLTLISSHLDWQYTKRDLKYWMV